jgi:hypothetical protein
MLLSAVVSLEAHQPTGTLSQGITSSLSPAACRNCITHSLLKAATKAQYLNNILLHAASLPGCPVLYVPTGSVLAAGSHKAVENSHGRTVQQMCITNITK